jgi:chromosome segregation ATPase
MTKAELEKELKANQSQLTKLNQEFAQYKTEAEAQKSSVEDEIIIKEVEIEKLKTSIAKLTEEKVELTEELEAIEAGDTATTYDGDLVQGEANSGNVIKRLLVDNEEREALSEEELKDYPDRDLDDYPIAFTDRYGRLKKGYLQDATTSTFKSQYGEGHKLVAIVLEKETDTQPAQIHTITQTCIVNGDVVVDWDNVTCAVDIA